jgi:hypothetical protein
MHVTDPPVTPFRTAYESTTGQKLPSLAIGSSPIPDIESLVAQLSAFIGDDPSLASGFAVFLLEEHYYATDTLRQILKGVCRRQSSKNRTAIVRRILRWYIGYQDPQNDDDQISTGLFSSWSSYLKFMGQLDEFSDSLLRSVIDDPHSHLASAVLFYMYIKKFHHVDGCPELFASFRSDFEKVRAFIASGSLDRAAYVPVVSHRDCGNPRCVKFGGCIPHDPSAGYPLCPDCHIPLTHIMTIYAGSLPEELQEWFPPDERDTVLVVGCCAQCFQEVPVFRYRMDEIDRLVFSPNFAIGRPFNESRVVEGWDKQMSLPSSSALEDLDIATVNLQYDPFQIWDAVLEESSRVVRGTYAGGYPEYVQGSARPTPTCRLLFEFCESEASTGMWGDAGTAQLWMETGDNYGFFGVTWDCC